MFLMERQEEPPLEMEDNNCNYVNCKVICRDAKEENLVDAIRSFQLEVKHQAIIEQNVN